MIGLIIMRELTGKEMEKILLSGSIPQVPIIVCKNDDVATVVQLGLHDDVSNAPTVIVAQSWPDEVDSNAVVITPLRVLGAEASKSSFSIKTELSEKARQCLNVAQRLAMSNEDISIRSLARGMYQDDGRATRRVVDHCVRELEQKGLIQKRGMGAALHLKLLTGRWRPDATFAKANGIEIENAR
jgi:hypothetical protein